MSIVKKVIELYHGTIIDADQSLNVAIIGIGNLGRAVAGYFKGKRSKLNLVASFDTDPQKVKKVIIKGILNFTTIPLNVPSWVYLEEYDMITSIEKWPISFRLDRAKAEISELIY